MKPEASWMVFGAKPLLALVLVFVLACDPGQRTQVVLELELPNIEELTTLAIRVDDGLGNQQEEMHSLADWGGAQPTVPLTLQVDRDEAIYRASLDLLDARGVVRVRARATGSFLRGELVRRTIVFDAECIDRATPCQPNRTCLGGSCVSACGEGDEELCAACVAVDTRGRDAVTSFVEAEDRAPIDAGGDTTCAVAEGALYCWGDNGAGQAGQDGLAFVPTPTRVGTFDDYVSVSVGDAHTCGLRRGGELVCFGDNEHGQLGLGDGESHAVDELVEGMFDSVSAGGELTCATRGEEVFCWGQSQWIGRGLEADLPCTDEAAPCAPGALGGEDWRQVAAGRRHACGIGSGAEVFCWGSGARGQVGTNFLRDAATPEGVVFNNPPRAQEAQSISAEGDTTCAAGIGRPRCWGQNEDGPTSSILPCGNPAARACIVPIPDEGVFGTVVGGDESLGAFCYLSGADAYCLGSNRHGQLGSGADALLLEAAPREDFREVLQFNGGELSNVVAGRVHGCFVTTLGEIYCYGSNTRGQVGLGSTSETAAPTLICIPGASE